MAIIIKCNDGRGHEVSYTYLSKYKHSSPLTQFLLLATGDDGGGNITRVENNVPA